MVVLCWVVFEVCVLVCVGVGVLFCSVLRAGGVLFKTRTQYRESIGIKFAEKMYIYAYIIIRRLRCGATRLLRSRLLATRL